MVLAAKQIRVSLSKQACKSLSMGGQSRGMIYGIRRSSASNYPQPHELSGSGRGLDFVRLKCLFIRKVREFKSLFLRGKTLVD